MKRLLINDGRNNHETHGLGDSPGQQNGSEWGSF
jgi:hypothetical protein